MADPPFNPAFGTIDNMVLPHLDLHVALDGAPSLKLEVIHRSADPQAPDPLHLDTVLSISTFKFLAPHNQPGHRFDGVPQVASDGTVVPAVPGVYLFQVAIVDNAHPAIGTVGSIVGRLQVHNKLVDWWYGIDSITTALDTKYGHAQPTIYARFDDDPVHGTDLVGDITGHGYVTLIPDEPAKIEVMPWGRLRGKAVTTTPTTVSGSLAGGAVKKLPVRVLDYANPGTVLVSRRNRGVTPVEDRINVVFLAEGFRNTQADRDLFDKIVKQAESDLFEKKRHEPFELLADRFNVFSVFTPSQDNNVTCGNRITDTHGTAVHSDVLGLLVPSPLVPSVAGKYDLRQLVENVGLPMRKEHRPNLPDVWSQQGLPDFKRDKADEPEMIKNWMAHQSESALQACDTFFGLYVGARFADGSRVTTKTLPVVFPANDTTDPAFPAFIDRLYDFYRIEEIGSLRLDPRRHPLELVANADLSYPSNVVLRYATNLQFRQPDGTVLPIGQQWVPDDTKFQPSRGMIVLVAYEGFEAGENRNRATLAMTTTGIEHRIEFKYDQPPPQGNPVMHLLPPRTVPDADHPHVAVLFDHVVSVVAHELGHSFNLGDEYETFGRTADSDEATGVVDIGFDNITQIGFLTFGDAANPRKLDIHKLKWVELPRVTLAGRLQVGSVPSTAVPGAIEVTVGTKNIAAWVQAFNDFARIDIRNFNVKADRRQLPLRVSPDQLQTDLRLALPPDQVRGVLVLKGLAPGPVPTFARGSAVYVAQRDQFDQPKLAVEADVLKFLTDPDDPRSHLPLNLNRDNINVSRDDDVPIAGPFHLPGNSFRLIGIFEGANHESRGFYRPAGACKMRATGGQREHGAFCFVCKWLIVNVIDPTQHTSLSRDWYPVF